ncbi:imidazole glycerol phosphate synthase subunit HisF [Candidatus Peregrinibacteria bacterium]|nr:imidazole glycerol phosphate synthase subunit HisF [Candidatus Peregrinibacteria bacterium]
MLLPRVIPCLLLKGKGLVKGVKFKDHRYIGDPINAVQIFNTMEVDELLFLDILATQEKRIPDLDLIQKIADQCLMPFGVGGGIQNVSQIRDILSSGAEKVCLNTSALENPDLIKEASEIFGRQSIVVSVDIKKNNGGTSEKRNFGNENAKIRAKVCFSEIPKESYDVYIHCGTKVFSDDLAKVIRLVEEKGAGEILLNSIDRDGTMEGYDLDIIRKVAENSRIPIIACGGAGSISDLRDGIVEGHASAVAAGSMFVFHGARKAVLINYPIEEELEKIRGRK